MSKYLTILNIIIVVTYFVQSINGNNGDVFDDKKTLMIVFDATASMGSSLDMLRTSAKKIMERFTSREDNPIHNYVLVAFRDPGNID